MFILCELFNVFCIVLCYAGCEIFYRKPKVAIEDSRSLTQINLMAKHNALRSKLSNK